MVLFETCRQNLRFNTGEVLLKRWVTHGVIIPKCWQLLIQSTQINQSIVTWHKQTIEEKPVMVFFLCHQGVPLFLFCAKLHDTDNVYALYVQRESCILAFLAAALGYTPLCCCGLFVMIGIIFSVLWLNKWVVIWGLSLSKQEILVRMSSWMSAEPCLSRLPLLSAVVARSAARGSDSHRHSILPRFAKNLQSATKAFNKWRYLHVYNTPFIACNEMSSAGAFMVMNMGPLDPFLCIFKKEAQILQNLSCHV